MEIKSPLHIGGPKNFESGEGGVEDNVSAP